MMNKIHSFAKIVLAAIGIFFAIRIMSQILMPLALATRDPSLKSAAIAVASTLFLGLCLALIWYVFLYKREHLAKRVVGTDELAEPASQIQWLPVAFRLICIAAGLYCLYTVTWNIIYNVNAYFSYEAKMYQFASQFLNTGRILHWLIMLTVGIYLVSGAPHFVRWQVRKTLEQSKIITETKNNRPVIT